MSNNDLAYEKEQLSVFERELITFFIEMAQLLNLPRSVGQIYGLLYFAKEPLSLEGVFQRLGISKGSASQGIRFLLSITAVRKVYVPGDRRDYYLAELKLRKLASGFLRERVEPQLGIGAEQLEGLAQLADEEGNIFEKEKVERLQQWHRKATLLLPVIRRLLASG